MASVTVEASMTRTEALHQDFGKHQAKLSHSPICVLSWQTPVEQEGPCLCVVNKPKVCQTQICSKWGLHAGLPAPFVTEQVAAIH